MEDEPKRAESDVHNWYYGAVVGYSWGEECAQIGHYEGFRCGSDNTITGGLLAGYLWRPNSVFGAGVEVDYSLRDLGQFNFGEYIATARARAGVYLLKEVFIYGTAGVARRGLLNEEDKHGPVFGGGAEYALNKKVNLRVEALHFRHDGVAPVNGDDNNTTVRAGLTVKLN